MYFHLEDICFCNSVANIADFLLLHLSCITFVSMGTLRNTKSLQAIRDAFDEVETALSGVELAKRFQSIMNKTTVYRILDRLERDDILHSFTDTHGLRWYAKSLINHVESGRHSHFQCGDCGLSKCLPIMIPVPSVPNHRIDSASLILVGQCDDCRVSLTVS